MGVNLFRVVSGYMKLSGYANNDIHYQDKNIDEHSFEKKLNMILCENKELKLFEKLYFFCAEEVHAMN